MSTERFPDDRPLTTPDEARSDWLRSLIATVGWDRARDPARLGIPARITWESLEAFEAFKPIERVHLLRPTPVLFAHVVDDPEFPFAQVLEAYERAGAPKDLLRVEGASHRSWIEPGTPAQRQYVPEVVAWLTHHLDAAADRRP